MELRERGLRLIRRSIADEDSFYRAVQETRYNDAIVRASYAVEKMVKAVVCFVGAEPPEYHGRAAIRRLREALEALPVPAGASVAALHFGEVGTEVRAIKEGSRVELRKRVGGAWTILGSAEANGQSIDVWGDGSTYGAVIDGEAVLTVTDTSISEDPVVAVRLPPVVATQEWQRVQQALRRLAEWRNPAEYGERDFTVSECQQAAEWLSHTRTWIEHEFAVI